MSDNNNNNNNNNNSEGGISLSRVLQQQTNDLRQIKQFLQKSQQVSDQRFAQIHQHLELKQGVHPRRAMECFKRADGDEKNFARCIVPPQPKQGGQDQGEDDEDDQPRRRPARRDRDE
jgi:hypothetical protein